MEDTDHDKLLASVNKLLAEADQFASEQEAVLAQLEGGLARVTQENAVTSESADDAAESDLIKQADEIEREGLSLLVELEALEKEA